MIAVNPLYINWITKTYVCSHMSLPGWFLESLEKYVYPSNYIISFFLN